MQEPQLVLIGTLGTIIVAILGWIGVVQNSVANRRTKQESDHLTSMQVEIGELREQVNLLSQKLDEKAEIINSQVKEIAVLTAELKGVKVAEQALIEKNAMLAAEVVAKDGDMAKLKNSNVQLARELANVRNQLNGARHRRKA